MQVIANKGRVPRKTVKRARDLMPGTHRLLLAAARYRSVEDAASEYECSRWVAIELWLKDLERRVDALEPRPLRPVLVRRVA